MIMEMGGVVDVLAVDTYSELELCRPIFFGVRLAKNVGSKSFLIFFQNSNGHIP
jgi:hypothetical protein